jgi:biopolymer transport protein ExbD
MADIAFLLIIFFLVTTSMSQDKGLGLTLPPIGSATLVPKTNITTVTIGGDGKITHENTPVTIDELGSRIASMTASNSNLIVSIKPAAGTRYEVFVHVIDTIKKAGNDKISVSEPEN